MLFRKGIPTDSAAGVNNNSLAPGGRGLGRGGSLTGAEQEILSPGGRVEISDFGEGAISIAQGHAPAPEFVNLQSSLTNSALSLGGARVFGRGIPTGAAQEILSPTERWNSDRFCGRGK